MRSKLTGFSLIELLVVVAIIGVLSAIGLLGYSKYIESSKKAANIANADLLAKAMAAEFIAQDSGTCTLSTIKQLGASQVGPCAYSLMQANPMKNPYTGQNYYPADFMVAPIFSADFCDANNPDLNTPTPGIADALGGSLRSGVIGTKIVIGACQPDGSSQIFTVTDIQ